MEAGVFPHEEVDGFALRGEVGIEEGLVAAVAKEFGNGAEGFGGPSVEFTLGMKMPVGCGRCRAGHRQ